LTDVASPDFHPLAAKAKDVAAGAVLIAAIGSVLIGLIIIGPYLLAFLKGRLDSIILINQNKH
jgi:diacylglycerol kinase (ATP)